MASASVMTPVQRIEAVLAGRQPDRPPFSFWHHFPADQHHGPAAVQAHIDHLHHYELDFLKVMNDDPYPHDQPITGPADLGAIIALHGDEPSFARQLDLLADLRRRLGGGVLMTTTIFNAWATLRQLIRRPTEHNPPDLDSPDPISGKIGQWIRTDPEAVEGALGRITTSLANFARRCIAAGADGIYLSVRDDWVAAAGGPGLYDRLLRASDLAILAEAAQGRLNILHVCGRPLDLAAFGQYPVHAISWADRAAGPTIAQANQYLCPVMCCGIDNLKTLPEGAPADVEAQIRDALRQAAGRPMIIAPGCTYDPRRVPKANLLAIGRYLRHLGG